MKMQIGEIAKKSGVTVRTLQYYDSIGLLKPAEVSESGYRYYNEDSLTQLERILYYKELGFPLKEIASDIGNGELLSKRRALERNKSRLDRLIEQIDDKLSQTAVVSPWFDKICRDFNYSGFVCFGGGNGGFFAWGRADIENDIGFTPRRRFPLGWVTTQLTAYCVLIIAEKKLLSTDSAVSEYFPEIGGADGVTVRDLLNMTSDIQTEKINEEWIAQNAAIADLPWEAAEHRTLTRTFVPSNLIEKITFGNKRSFCVNLGNYTILQAILEKAADKPFADILSEYVCEPLDMRDTAFSGNADVIAYADNRRIEGDFPNEIVSSAEDMTKFYNAIINGYPLPLETLLREIPDGGFGCGWYRCKDALSHNSDLGGFALETELRLNDGRSCINLRNRLPVPDSGDRVMFFDVKSSDDGYVKLEAWEANNGANFGVYSIKVYDSAANELYSVEKSGEYFVEVNNTGEKRQASEFSPKYFYELDLKEILGDKFSSDRTYVIETRAHCDTFQSAQLGYVYQSGGEWISGCYWVFRAPWMAYDLFMEQLNLCREIENNSD